MVTHKCCHSTSWLLLLIQRSRVAIVESLVAALGSGCRKHRIHDWMGAIQSEILTARRISHHVQHALIDTVSQQLTSGFAGKAAAEAILWVERVADKVRYTADSTPRPVPVYIVEKLNESRLIRHHWSLVTGIAWC